MFNGQYNTDYGSDVYKRQIYSLSDPRAKIFKQFVKSLSEEKGLTEEYGLYSLVEKLAPEVIMQERKTYNGVRCVYETEIRDLILCLI